MMFITFIAENKQQKKMVCELSEKNQELRAQIASNNPLLSY